MSKIVGPHFELSHLPLRKSARDLSTALRISSVMGRVRYAEVGLIVAAVAVAGFLLRSDPMPETASPEPAPSPVPVASIAGVKLGDTQAQVELKWGKSKKLNTGDGLTWWDYRGRYVGFGKNRLVESVGGRQVELDGKAVLGPLSVDIEDVESVLGKPDSTGFGGVAMCEGPYPGYRYDKVMITATFSCNADTFFQLGHDSHFMKFDHEPDAPDLAACIASHRRGRTFALRRGRRE